MTFINDGFYSAFQKARAVQGRIRRQIQIETGTADWKTLREWSRLIVQPPGRCDPERMARLVMRHDPKLKLEKLARGWIIGGGKGLFNLNAYRCGTLNGDAVFEKIYLRESEAWRRLDWFYSNIVPRLNGRVRVPQLLHRVQGEYLAAAYYEFLPNVELIPAHKRFDAIRNFHRQVSDIDMTGEPAWIADFRLEPQYNEGAVCLRGILTAAGRDPLDVDELEQRLLTRGNRRVLTHGDLIKSNISKDGTIFDWDRCGAFPAGYEFSRIMGASVDCTSIDEFEKILEGDIILNRIEAPGGLHFFAAADYAKKNCLKRKVRVSDDLILDLFDRARVLQGLSEMARWSA